MLQKAGRVIVINPSNDAEKDKDMVQNLLGELHYSPTSGFASGTTYEGPLPSLFFFSFLVGDGVGVEFSGKKCSSYLHVNKTLTKN